MNGSLTGKQEASPGQRVLDMRGYIDMSFWVFFWEVKWHINVFKTVNNYEPATGQYEQVYDTGAAAVSFTPWTAQSISRTNTNPLGSLDVVSGGLFNSLNDYKEQVVGDLTNRKIRKDMRIPSKIENLVVPHSFISTHSALDTSGFSNWHQPITQNLVCTKQTPFDSYYGASNNTEHVSFTQESVQWLYKELGDSNSPPSPQIPVFPSEASLLSGAGTLCIGGSATYNFSDNCKLPGNATWTVNNSNAKIASSTESSVTLTGIANGSSILTATFQNGQTITKKIWVGPPTFGVTQINNQNFYNESHFYLNSETPLSEQEVSSIEWNKISSSDIYSNLYAPINATEGFARGRGNSWTIEVEVKATNICGSTSQIVTITPPAFDCEKHRIAETTDNEYIVDRNVEPDCLKARQYGNILTERSVPQSYEIVVANNLGVIVVQKYGDTFSLAGLPTGTYFVRISQNNKILVSQTLIKK